MFITKELFDSFPNGEIFASGILPNSPDGLFMTNDGGNLRWVAVKGYGDDWAIYCGWSDHSESWIKTCGDKVTSKENVKKCISCNSIVLNKYRY